MATSRFEDFREAVEILGRGFLTPVGNRALRQKLADGRLTHRRFCEQVTILACRLTFLLVAEESGWLKRALGDEVFSGHAAPNLAESELADEAMVEAIRLLVLCHRSGGELPAGRSGSQPRQEYQATASGLLTLFGELGAVHEAMLELQPLVEVAGRQFKLLTAAGSHRKSTGSYYTPPAFIDCLLDSALEPVVKEMLKRAEDGKADRRAVDDGGRLKLERVLLGLRICDPSCGAGYFLAAAARRLARHLAVIRSGEENPSSDQFAAALRDVVGQCIYGVDISAVAVELCILTLQIELLSHGVPPVCLDGRIVCGNALTGNADGKDCRTPSKIFLTPFSVVIGNPPYRAALSDVERRTVRRLYPLAAPTSNSAADFVELCSRMVRPGGRVGLVVPKSLTYSYSWRKLRAALAPAVASAVDVGRGWDDVLLEQVLLTYCPGQRKRRYVQVSMLQQGVLRSRRLEARLIEQLEILPTGLDGNDLKLLESMLRPTAGTLSQICTTQRGMGLQRLLRENGEIPVIGGRDLEDFAPLRPRTFVRCSQVEPARLRWTQPPQAIFQNIIAHVTRPADHIRLIGTVARERVACLDTVNLLTIQDPRVSPEGLCALLMSDLIGWFVYACVYNKAVRTMHFDGYFLAKIPLPQGGSLSALEPAASELASDPHRPENWRAANEAAFDLYGISSRLRQHVPLSAPCKC